MFQALRGLAALFHMNKIISQCTYEIHGPKAAYILSNRTQPNMDLSQVLNLKVPIKTVAVDIHKYVFIVFQRK